MADLRLGDLSGKVYLVTGASTGIGAAVARALGAQGAKVAVHYNASRSGAEEVSRAVASAGGEAIVIRGDLSRAAGADSVVAKAAERFGRIDGLINNAGSMLGRKPLMEATDEHVQAVTDLNAHSLVACCRAAVPWLRKQGGVIINTTSIAARNGGSLGTVFYAASKGYVSTFTRGLAKELVPDRIRVNAVSPGVIDTAFHERFSSEAQMNAAVATIPMGRAGSAEECVGCYLFLASDRMSGFITGQIIEVNGGQLMP